MTYSAENYLKTIFHLGEQEENEVSTSALAKAMHTKASSVTDMAKKLAKKGLLNYRPYQGVTLTASGRQHALKVIRKHRLWEYFLVEKLHFKWDEVHEIAEQLEHIKSEKLTDLLEAFLDFPKLDPHGDPIPNKRGEFPETEKVLLSECSPGSTGIFVGVEDSSRTFLRFLDKQEIALGDLIEILNHEEYDHSFLIRINSIEKTISPKTAQNLFLHLK